MPKPTRRRRKPEALRNDDHHLNTYCHPRKETVDALTGVLGGAGVGVVHAFPSMETCKTAPASHWVDEPASDKLWVTARDGDVVLTTTGDGEFTRE